MSIVVREGALEDAEACGRICFESFKSISSQHSFPLDFPDTPTAIGMMQELLADPTRFAVVAEVPGHGVIGSNFVLECDAICGVGPTSVDPDHMDNAVGRQLMAAIMARCTQRNAAGVHLLQAAYHNRSFALYSKFGFQARDVVVELHCPAAEPCTVRSLVVREAIAEDQAACDELCVRILGFSRHNELAASIAQGTARVVVGDGAIVAYASSVSEMGHTVANTSDGIKALVGDAGSFAGGSLLVPARCSDVLQWCLGRGARIVHLMTLMAVGAYIEPTGPYMPSLAY